jgi:hypothetical protein
MRILYLGFILGEEGSDGLIGLQRIQLALVYSTKLWRRMGGLITFIRMGVSSFFP